MDQEIGITTSTRKVTYQLLFPATTSTSRFKGILLFLSITLLLAIGVPYQAASKSRLSVRLLSNRSTDSTIVIRYSLLADTTVYEENPLLYAVINNKHYLLEKEKNTLVRLTKRKDSISVTFRKPPGANFKLDKFGKFRAVVSGVDFIFEYTGIALSLSYFKGIYKGMYTTLEWKTNQELEIHYFVVEKKKGDSYQEVGRMEAAGFSNAPTLYTLDDFVNDANTVDYYRLKTVEYGGRYSYSNLIAVAREGSERNYLGFKIRMDETPKQLLQFSSTGTLLQSINLQENKRTEIPAHSAGWVIYTLLTDKSKYFRKVLAN